MRVVTLEIAVGGFEDTDNEDLAAESYVLDALARINDTELGFHDWQSWRVANDWSESAKSLGIDPLPEQAQEQR